MTQAISSTRRHSGRPTIDDHAALWLFIQVECKKADLSIRAFCESKTTCFYGDYFGMGRRRPKPITNETLRRRYRQSCMELGLVPAIRLRGWAAVDRDADDPMIRETREMLNFLAESLAA